MCSCWCLLSIPILCSETFYETLHVVHNNNNIIIIIMMENCDVLIILRLGLIYRYMEKDIGYCQVVAIHSVLVVVVMKE